MSKYYLLFTYFICTSCFANIDLVKVDKSAQIIQLLEQGKVIKEYQIALGANPQGHKQQEGDEKTPEGNYTLDYKKEDSSFYRAMHISYPNANDRQQAKQRGVSAGGFIMIHGQKNGFGWLSILMQQFNWTNGCIALTNAEMDEFMSLVAVGTPIHIKW
jgi:murein L,D-transpeptidase YafK